MQTITIPQAAIEAAAAAPEPTEAAPVPAQEAAPAAPAADAGLADAIREHAQKIQANVASAKMRRDGEDARQVEPEQAAEQAKPEAEAAPAEQATEAEQAKATTEQDADDRLAEALARYTREARALSQRQKELDRRQREADAAKQAEAADRDAFARFMAAKSKDPLAAIEELLGKDVFGGDFLLKVAQRASAEDPETMTDEQKQAILAARVQAETLKAIEEKQKAEEERRQAEAKRQNDESKERYFTTVQAQFLAAQQEYPFLAADPVPVDEMDATVIAYYNQTRVLPSPEQLLQHFNGLRKQKAERMAKTLGLVAPKTAPAAAPVAAAKPVQASARPSVDTGGRPASPLRTPKDYREHREDIIRRLEAQDRANRG